MIRQVSVFVVFAVPALGFSQLSVFDAEYRLEATARSGISTDNQVAFANNMGPVASFSHRIDAFASQQSSTVHSWSSVAWNVSPTDFSLDLEACWDSFDLGAGNSGHMLSRATLGISLATTSFVSISAVFDFPSSFAAIDRWVSNAWVPFVTSAQILNYGALWNPGDYRLRAQRLYNPIGNSTFCVPFHVQGHAEPVPEPASLIALGVGVGVLMRRRKTKRT